MTFKYSFPASKKAKERTLNEQVTLLREESIGVYRACMDWDETAMIAGTMGVILAAEGTLRKYTKEQVEAAFEFVKSWARDHGEIS